MIAYLRDDDTTGHTQELRIIPIREDGRPAAPSTKLEPPFGTQDLLAGWTARNEIGILKFVPGSSSIYKVALTGGRAARISALYGDHPRWSPDGSQLAYTYNGIIWLVPLDNPQPVRVETGRPELMANYIDWSPDGKWLAFSGYTGLDRQLHLMTDFISLVTRQDPFPSPQRPLPPPSSLHDTTVTHR